MKDVTTNNFGLLIAFVLPGLVLLWGMAPYSTTISGWLGQTTSDNATVGGFLYITLASVGVGQLVSTLRWLLIDSLHHRTGIHKPDWSFSQLSSRNTVAAFDRLIEDHYRFYQFHANGLVSLTLAMILRWQALEFRFGDCVFLLLCDALLFVGARDNLSKYYRRVENVLSRSS